jgi:hypothetical protein
MIQLRRPNGGTPPSAHSCMRRSSSDPIRLSCLRALMLVALFPPCITVPIHPRHFASPSPVPRRTALHPLRPSPCWLLYAAFPTGPSLPRPPPLHCLLTAAGPLAATASTELASGSSLHRDGEPPRRMLQQAGKRDEIRVTLHPPTSCSCRCRIASSMRRRHASIRPSKAYVARVCFKCFRCFIWMLQVLYLDIAKDVAHVAVTTHICFKCMLQMFYLVFQTYVCKCCHTYVSYVITHMLQVFYLDVCVCL